MKIATLAAPLFAALTLSPFAAAQVAEKIEVRVVNVDVAVTDRNGRPIDGLTQHDFELLEDGVAQEVTNFYTVDERARRAAASGGAQTEAGIGAERFRRKVLVLVDDMHVSTARRAKALTELEAFLDRAGDDTEWSVVTVDRKPHLILPLTAEKAKVRAALAGVRRMKANDVVVDDDVRGRLVDPLPYATPMLAFRMDTEDGLGCFGSTATKMLKLRYVRASMDAMLSAVRGFAGVEGKKALFVITSELPIEPIGVCDNRYIIARDEENRRREEIKGVLTREANASNTSIYILGADNANAQDITGHSPSPQPAGDAGMHTLAAATGGRFLNRVSMAESLDDFDRSTGTFYSLGYKPKHADDQRYHRITVRLKDGRGYRLWYRNGYSDVVAEQQLERSMRSLIGISMQTATIPMSLTRGTATAGGAVPLSASLPMERVQLIEDAGGAHGEVDLYLSVFNEAGVNVGSMKASHTIRLTGDEPRDQRVVVRFDPFRLPKGTYTVAAAVRDRLGEDVGVAVDKIRF